MLQKQPVAINFAQGLDTKTDPWQVPAGKFLALENSVFNKGGMLQKRNGYAALPSLPDSTSTYVTTFNQDLTAIGSNLKTLSTGSSQWISKGSLQPLSLGVLPLIRNNLNQIQSDSAIADNGLVCVVYTENNGSSNSFKYSISNSDTGQSVVSPTVISGADATYGTPKVFLLGGYFVVIYTTQTGGNYRLTFIAISTNNPATVTTPVNITTSYTPSATVNFDAAVLNGSLYVAWNGAAASGVKVAYISSSLGVTAAANPDASHVATLMSVCSDTQNNVVWVSYYNLGTTTGYTLALSPQLALLTHYPAQIISSGTVLNITSSAQSGTLSVFYEVSNTATGVQTNLIKSSNVTQSSGSVSAAAVIARSVGLASKSFIYNGDIYLTGVYSSTYQPTLFLINATQSTSTSPVIAAKLAYQNSGGYLTAGLPSVSISNGVASVSYLFKDLIQAVNKNTNVPSGSQTAGIYSQTGINLGAFSFGSQDLVSSEIGSNLNISGGFLWGYDGYAATEQGFFLYPDSVQATWSATGGSIHAQPDGSTNTNAYYYQVTYEWTDNQGNAFRSAPSIPVAVTTTSNGTAGSVSLVIPTLRLTYKTANPVKIVVYRWSVAQQSYYQTTSISAPTLNSTTADSVTFVDTNADATILGNNLIYTTGGVLENIASPAVAAMTLFDDRLWVLDAEDRNLLLFSKQVIESTPVEMSDLLSVYVAPTIGSQGSTGPITAIASMDDKLIIFKKDAIYYINGAGPDNTGSNSQYSQPIFVTAAVGSVNQRSIVLMPSGLMFQSDKGIWLLGRDLSTNYIGAPVESFTSSASNSALGIPATNQIRFTLGSGQTLMFDYYYGQWGTFTGVPAISATLFQGLHTYINQYGQVFQESPGSYLDGSSPVLMSFQTAWINLAGLQGYQRAYFFYLLGKYLTPFKLACSIAYDYEDSLAQLSIINPTNFSPTYGGPESNGQETVYGQGTPYGGGSNVLNWRVFLARQRCSAIQVSIQEIYDPSFGVPAGAGFSLSGLNMVCAVKKGFRPASAAESVGGQ